jgi:hypothetical protein
VGELKGLGAVVSAPTVKKVVPTKKSVVIAAVEVAADDGYPSVDVSAPVRPPDPAHMGAFARLASARDPRVTAPTAAVATLWSAIIHPDRNTHARYGVACGADLNAGH